MAIADNKERIIVTVEKDLKEQLKKMATTDGRNLSNYIAKLLKDHAERE